MKKLLIITIFSFLCCASYAQSTTTSHAPNTVTPKIKRADSLAKADRAKAMAQYDSIYKVGLSKEVKAATYIFEGTLVQKKSYRGGVRGGFIYTAQIFRIHKVFKGNLTCGTVKIISGEDWPPSDNDVVLPGGGYGGMLKGTSGIFLCSPNTFPDSPVITNKPSNSIVLQIDNMVKYDPTERTMFGSYSNIYSNILQEPGTKMEKCDGMDFKKYYDSISKYNKEHPRYYPSDTAKLNQLHNINPPGNNNPSKGLNNEEDTNAIFTVTAFKKQYLPIIYMEGLQKQQLRRTGYEGQHHNRPFLSFEWYERPHRNDRQVPADLFSCPPSTALFHARIALPVLCMPFPLSEGQALQKNKSRQYCRVPFFTYLRPELIKTHTKN